MGFDLGDLTLQMYLSAWGSQPDRRDLGEQVFLHAVVAWDVGVMVMSSRKMFNLVKSAVWARVAAWSEWVAVRVVMYLLEGESRLLTETSGVSFRKRLNRPSNGHCRSKRLKGA